jgi:hypothetical protein
VHRPEILEDLERGILDQAAVVLVADQPAALADALQQEHVVVVEVGADAAAVDGIAHHQVVEARLGDEVETVEELVAIGQNRLRPCTSTVHGCFLLRSEAFWGPRMTPSVVVVGDVAGLDVRVAGELEKFVLGDDAGEAGNRLADRSGFFCQYSARNSSADRPPRSIVIAAL